MIFDFSRLIGHFLRIDLILQAAFWIKLSKGVEVQKVNIVDYNTFRKYLFKSVNYFFVSCVGTVLLKEGSSVPAALRCLCVLWGIPLVPIYCFNLLTDHVSIYPWNIIALHLWVRTDRYF